MSRISEGESHGRTSRISKLNRASHLLQATESSQHHHDGLQHHEASHLHQQHVHVHPHSSSAGSQSSAPNVYNSGVLKESKAENEKPALDSNSSSAGSSMGFDITSTKPLVNPIGRASTTIFELNIHDTEDRQSQHDTHMHLGSSITGKGSRGEKMVVPADLSKDEHGSQ